MSGSRTKFAQKTLCALWLALCACALTSPVLAQMPPAAPDKAAKEAADLSDQLDDLNQFSVITPLKLTPDQLDKIIVIVEREQTALDKKLAASSSPLILKMGDEIRAMRKLAVEGKPTPQSFFDKAKIMVAEYGTLRKNTSLEMLAVVSKQLQAVLTKEQVSVAAKLSKDAAAAQKVAIKGSDEQWFNAFLINAVVNNNRFVPLLKEMRASAKSASVTSPGPIAGK